MCASYFVIHNVPAAETYVCEWSGNIKTMEKVKMYFSDKTIIVLELNQLYCFIQTCVCIINADQQLPRLYHLQVPWEKRLKLAARLSQ
jgi:hypothetical protein